MHTRTIGLLVVLMLGVAIASAQQCPPMPPGFLCVTQEAGNKAAENARTVAALEEKDKANQEALALKDKTIAELKETNAANVLDLTKQLNKITADWAMEVGRRTQLEADKVLWTEVIKVLVQNSRQKTNGIKIF